MKSAEFLAEVNRRVRRTSGAEVKWVPELRRVVGPVRLRDPRLQIEALNRLTYAASLLDEAAK